MDLNPVGNAGLMPNVANLPTSPNSLRPGQSISDLTFLSGISQRFIRITMNPISNQNIGGRLLDPGQSPGSISIVNRHALAIWTAGDVDQNYIQHIQPGGQSDDPDVGALQIIMTRASSAPNVDISGWTDGAFNPAMRLTNQGTGDGLSIETIDGGIPLVLSQDTPILTNFFPVIKSGFGSTVVIYFGNQNDPNGVLFGSTGDVCLNASATGQIAYCEGGSVWTYA
jgi:hypothetical protein